MFIKSGFETRSLAVGSADMLCPRPPLMTQVQLFVSRIKKRQRWDVQTMWAYDLDLWLWRSWRLPLMQALPLGIYSTFCVCALVGLRPWPLTLKLVRNVARVMGHPPANFGYTTTIRFRYMGQPTRLRLITWPCYLDLWPWILWRLWLMRVVFLHPYTKFEGRRPCYSEDMAHDVCQH